MSSAPPRYRAALPRRVLSGGPRANDRDDEKEKYNATISSRWLFGCINLYCTLGACCEQ